jgi:hypothetical protein
LCTAARKPFGGSAVRGRGSANWTLASANHVEFGATTDDKELAGNALRFLADVIRLSELRLRADKVERPTRRLPVRSDDVADLGHELIVDEPVVRAQVHPLPSDRHRDNR